MTDTISVYRRIERLGISPLGETFRARDTRRGRTVTLTLIDESLVATPEARARLIEALHAASELSHPHIAGIWEVGEEDGLVYAAFEHFTGVSLRDLTRRGALEPTRAVSIATGIAEALAEAWARQMVHRELRPETVFVTSRDQVKVTGFGLSAWTAAPGVSPYHSPEQVLGEVVDHRSDIFSLGTILYELITGRAPFAAATPDETAVRILQARPPRPGVIELSVPPELDAIVMKALSKSLDGRYQVAATMAAELRALAAVLEHRIAHGRMSPHGRGALGRAAVAAALAVLAVISVAAAWRFWSIL